MDRSEQIKRKINELNSEQMKLRMELREIERSNAAQSVQVGDCFFGIDGSTVMVVTSIFANGLYCVVDSVGVRVDSGNSKSVSAHIVHGDELLRHDVATLKRATTERYLELLSRASEIISSLNRTA